MENIKQILVNIAAEEGNKFRAEYGREPTEAEAQRMADTIMRQARIACSMMR